MKNKKPRSSTFTIVGAISFFAFIAIIIQIAILAYDYIISRTDSTGLIAVLILILIIMLSVVATVMDLIRRKIMVERPVKRIIRATERIASGDFKTRLEISHSYDKYDEYDIIMDNLNIMAEELSKSEVLKTDFISNVSHEIKTPLMIIQSYATLLQDKSIDEESREKHAKTIAEATKKLSSLITNILKLNKLENQIVRPEYEKVNLTELVSEAVLQYEELIEKKEIILDCDLEDISIVSCGSYIELLLNNLISNAIKFTTSGGEVFVGLKKAENGAEITVRDTGCGIDSETGKLIFEKFYQGDTSHKSEGNGLGLALVKRVIDILGGEICVESEKDKGSTFLVKINNVE
jgi:signal transduction histidine kinase